MGKRAAWHRTQRDAVREIRRFVGKSEETKRALELARMQARNLAAAGWNRNKIASYLKVSLSLVDHACVGIVVQKPEKPGKSSDPTITDEELAQAIECLYRERQERMAELSKKYDEKLQERKDWDCLAWIRKQMDARGNRVKEAAACHGDESQ